MPHLSDTATNLQRMKKDRMKLLQRPSQSPASEWLKWLDRAVQKVKTQWTEAMLLWEASQNSSTTRETNILIYSPSL